MDESWAHRQKLTNFSLAAHLHVMTERRKPSTKPASKPDRPSTAGTPGTVSVPRALSKLGFCSRTQGERLVKEGRVRVNGTLVRDASLRIRPERDEIVVDGSPVTHVE